MLSLATARAGARAGDNCFVRIVTITMAYAIYVAEMGSAKQQFAGVQGVSYSVAYLFETMRL
jgi:hypothetical protein